MTEWTDQRLASLYQQLETLAEEMPGGSTEGAYLREAARSVEGADAYIEKREREA